MTDRPTMPYDLDAEKTLLACVFLDSQIFDQISVEIGPEHFYRKPHSEIFKAMAGLDGEGKPITHVTVIGRMREDGTLGDVGGAAYIAEITDFQTTTVNLGYFIDRVKDLAVLRELSRTAQKIAANALRPGASASKAVEEAEASIYAIGQNAASDSELKTSKAITANVLEQLSAAMADRSKLTGLSTGFSKLDGWLCGLQKSDLVILAARPSMGKSAFALNICENVAVKNRVPTLFISVEMGAEQPVQRILASLAGVALNRIRTGNVGEDELNRIANAAGTISSAPLFVDDKGTTTVQQIRSKARRAKAQHGIELIVIDYLQLITAGDRRTNRTEDVSEMSRGLKLLARDLNVPIICLSQLNRSVELRTDKRPQLSDLRESGSIEQDADVVLFLKRHDYYDSGAVKGETEVIIAKHRNGQVGAFDMMFEADKTKFRDLTFVEQKERE